MPGSSLVGRVQRRVFQFIAEFAPGAGSLRVWLHRRRGVRIGSGCFISYQVLLETEHPELIEIGDDVVLGMRCMVIAHNRDATPSGPDAEPTVRIGRSVFVGPGAIVLPNVTIGDGAVVTAGSVVATSVAAMTMVQGNPARPIAAITTPLGVNGTMADFVLGLRPLSREQRRERSND
jgi:acetyltransferase-like isoleucine patch superfamily enzyme